MQVRQKGRPSDADERLEKEKRVYDLLDSLGVGYEYIDHQRTDTMGLAKRLT